jgi:hypothetical protein
MNTSKPCGHRFSGDLTGFGALASNGRCVTSIKRADTANVSQSNSFQASDVDALTLSIAPFLAEQDVAWLTWLMISSSS